MTIEEIYDEAIKPLPPSERFRLATLILNAIHHKASWRSAMPGMNKTCGMSPSIPAGYLRRNTRRKTTLLKPGSGAPLSGSREHVRH
jgi:hypothetical protein